MSKKHSHKRDAVELMICSSREHPSADNVYAALRESYPSISLATIYRNIAQLRNDGVIRSVGVVDGIERYDGNTEDHPHFVCENCGAVIDIDPEDASGDSSLICEKYGVFVERREVLYYGSCGKCAEKQNRSL